MDLGVNLFGRQAIFSPCGRYRYRLERRWGEAPSLVACLLNPSTADDLVDDPTVRRLVGYAAKWGHGGLTLVNQYGWRATDPRALDQADDPVGPENDVHVAAATLGQVVLVGWGANGVRRSDEMRTLLGRAARVLCLGRTKDGQPVHPLYQPAAAVPEAW